ncbi:MAG: SpvB/TcaC N-terminal domain-containing protein, partial [Cyanobacteria bacterium J06639_16]
MQESQPGISLPQIRLPKGGGAIRGVGETFQPSSFTGTASFTLPIETPTARDLSLDLSLSYSSGSSQGPFGLGFSLSTPHIVRRTEKRLPDYSDADEFVLSNVEYLVPTLIEQGDQWVTQDFDGDNGTYRVRRYRTRTEGSFLRVERWTRRADGDVHWRVTTAENVTSIYGESPIARIAHPENPQQIFQWLIERTEDSRGNQIRYTYRAEDGVGIANTVYEQGRDQTVQRYLQKIEYGNFFDENGQTQWAFSVVFDYGDYDLSDLDSLTADPTGTWSARPDPFSDYRAGFEVRTHRLCRNILVFHHFPDELGVQDALVRSLHLTYTESPVITFLQGVQSFGYRRSPDGIEVQPTPPVTFDYSDYDPLAQTFQPLQAEHSRLPLRLDGTDYQLLDIYGEGITGLFYDRQGTHLYYRPQGNGVYETGQPLAEYPIEQFQNPPLYTVTDGLFTRLNVRAGGRSGYYQRDSETSWDNFQAFQG